MTFTFTLTFLTVDHCKNLPARIMELTTAQAMLTLGILAPDGLVDVATQAVVSGVESQELAALAGLTAAEHDEAAALFHSGLRSLGMKAMTKTEALQAYAREIAQRIVRQECEPYAGAKSIWHAIVASGLETHEFDPFVYAASEYEDRPDDRTFFASEIMSEAQRVL